ncbi:MAG: PAS domain-containing protein [Archaeoglobales archaeon]|nr:PAS domain-containing protein [Archaeoglobales archaeon]
MKPKIRIEIFGKANRRLLEDFLSEKYEISEAEFDLLIIDEFTLKMRREEVEKIRSGTFLPVLLVARERLEEEVWELVDEVIMIPIQKAELLKRVEALLRARMQAIELEKHSKMLELELGALFESIGNPVLIISPNFEIIYANRKTKELLEAIGIRDPVGLKCHKVFHGKDQPVEICPVNAMLKSGKTETREMEVQALGGSFVVTTTPIFEEGKLKKIIHIAVDVSPLREAEKELRSLFSEISRLNELLRIIYRVNRQMVKKHDFEEVLSDLVGELSKLGECCLTSNKERYCVRQAIESNEIFRGCSEECEFYAEHKDKQVIAYPLKTNSDMGVLLFISERLRESEFELIKTLLEDIEFVKEKLKLEKEKIRLLEQLQKNIDEIAYLVDGIRNPLAVIFAYTELFADENFRQRIYEQISKIDEIISKLDVAWIESEKIRNALTK